MKVGILLSKKNHQHTHGHAIAEGFANNGIQTFFFYDDPPKNVDFLAVWGWRRAPLWRARGHEILVMERGYIGDRFEWTSIGWNGLNGRARFNSAFDTGERLETNYGKLIKPWRHKKNGYALIMGQVPGDAALAGTDIFKWAVNTAEELKAFGHEVRYRHHPLAFNNLRPTPLPSMPGTLDEALAGAKFVVTYNSNSGVDAVINGIPTVTTDVGAMAWPVTSHDTEMPIITPDRKQWLIDMSWKQWSLDEIKSGSFWQYVKRDDLVIKKTNVLILGGGPNVWDEAEKAFDNFNIDYVIAINNCIQDYPGRVDAAITLHPAKMNIWLNERKRRNYSLPGKVIAHKVNDCVTDVLPYLWPEMKYSGSSGLYAVKIAMELFYADKIILAGVPMNNSPHYYKTQDQPWNSYNAFIPAWENALPRLRDKVRSFSGYTARLLGEPTKEWLND